MDIEVTSDNYLEIVNKYGKTIESVDFMLLFGASEELLPYKRETIKSALQIALIHEYSKEKQNGVIINALKSGYMNLASFIPSEDFKKISYLYTIDRDCILDKAKHEKALILKLAEKVNQGAKLLLEEINSLMEHYNSK